MRGGRIANTAGDGLIAEFPSVVEAVAAAVAIQRDLEAGEGLLPFRIGLHLGDVIVDGEDLLGDGVNLAARLQDMAREGGILATQQVIDHARGRLEAEFRSLGVTRPKGYSEDIPVYAVFADGVTAPVGITDVIPRLAPGVPNGQPPLSERARKFKKARSRNYVFMGGFMALDIITGSGIGWFIYPFGAIGLLTYLGWLRLDEEDQDALRATRKRKKKT